MTDVSTLESLVATNNELLAHIYAVLLFLTAVGSVTFVIFLLYKCLRKFF